MGPQRLFAYSKPIKITIFALHLQRTKHGPPLQNKTGNNYLLIYQTKKHEKKYPIYHELFPLRFLSEKQCATRQARGYLGENGRRHSTHSAASTPPALCTLRRFARFKETHGAPACKGSSGYPCLLYTSPSPRDS